MRGVTEGFRCCERRNCWRPDWTPDRCGGPPWHWGVRAARSGPFLPRRRGGGVMRRLTLDPVLVALS